MNMVENLTAPAPMSLAAAIRWIEDMPRHRRDGQQDEMQRRAFARLCIDLEQYGFAQKPLASMPLLLLITSRLGQLADPAQREQAMSFIEQTLRATPHLVLTEALALQLEHLPAALQRRALRAIAHVLIQTADLPPSHFDILLALTRAMRDPACREPAYALVQEGLARLRDEPEMCGEIRLGLMQTFARESRGLALQS
ncbi:hypothetical protein RCH09_001792 [Actimicrobium sp. GrIS 1.19]|uniref:hypothetical protein n=1 Tax=Actimicrobium sp. GrIS 1.19 TaxID=3071708 RepID=UPI002E076F4F|nr:hypothetical protein [Actimicrobium sp. GrIS 1.19]